MISLVNVYHSRKLLKNQSILFTHFSKIIYRFKLEIYILLLQLIADFVTTFHFQIEQLNAGEMSDLDLALWN